MTFCWSLFRSSTSVVVELAPDIGFQKGKATPSEKTNSAFVLT